MRAPLVTVRESKTDSLQGIVSREVPCCSFTSRLYKVLTISDSTDILLVPVVLNR